MTSFYVVRDEESEHMGEVGVRRVSLEPSDLAHLMLFVMKGGSGLGRPADPL